MYNDLSDIIMCAVMDAQHDGLPEEIKDGPYVFNTMVRFQFLVTPLIGSQSITYPLKECDSINKVLSELSPKVDKSFPTDLLPTLQDALREAAYCLVDRMLKLHSFMAKLRESVGKGPVEIQTPAGHQLRFTSIIHGVSIIGFKYLTPDGVWESMKLSDTDFEASLRDSYEVENIKERLAGLVSPTIDYAPLILEINKDLCVEYMTKFCFLFDDFLQRKSKRNELESQLKKLGAWETHQSLQSLYGMHDLL